MGSVRDGGHQRWVGWPCRKGGGGGGVGIEIMEGLL